MTTKRHTIFKTNISYSEIQVNTEDPVILCPTEGSPLNDMKDGARLYTMVRDAEGMLDLTFDLQSENYDITINLLRPLLINKYNYLVKFVEDVLYFLYSLTMIKTNVDVIFCVTNFIKLRLGDGALIVSIHDNIKHILDKFQKLSNSIPQHELRLQSFENLNGLLNYVKEIRESKIISHFGSVIVSLLSMNLFAKYGLDLMSIGYTRMEAKMHTMSFWKSSDNIYKFLESLLFIAERVWDCIIKQDLSYLFKMKDTFANIAREVMMLREWNILRKYADANIDDRISDSEFLSKLEITLQKLQDMKKYMVKLETCDLNEKVVHSYINELQMMRCEVLNMEYARSERMAPFGILLYGDSGIGKTTIQNLLMHVFSCERNLPFGDLYKYVKNPAAKYWDGFRSTMWCVILDDIAYIKPDACQGMDPTQADVIQILNSVAFVPDQAALEDKGRHPMKAELVIGSTNTEHMNAFNYFSCPSAAQRRLPFVLDVRVKSEFLNEQGMLDSSKAKCNAGEYPDFWIWTVKRVVPQV